MTNPQIDRFEWDFTGCSSEELELCFEYERARHSPEEIKDAEQWRRMFPGNTFDDYWKHLDPPNTGDGYLKSPMSAAHLYPEFPLRAYLAIPQTERSRRLAMIAGVGILPVATDDGSWFEEGFDDLLSEFPDPRRDGVSHHGASYYGGSVITCRDMYSTFAAFRFNWRASDAAYLSAMKAWLLRNRDKTVGIRDARGGGSGSREFKAKLNQLGAWRLLNFPMTWEDAANHTQLVRGTALYSEQPAWIRARNEADRFLGMCNR